MKRLPVPYPPLAILEALNKALGPVNDRWFSGILQSQTLAALRDLLLPKLISGELRVPDAEKLVEAAL